jgi:transposase
VPKKRLTPEEQAHVDLGGLLEDFYRDNPHHPNNPAHLDNEQLEFRFKLDEKFVKVMSHWLRDGTAANMGGNSFLVLCFIRSFVGSRGTTAGPSQIRISKSLKLNIKTVRKCIEKLEELGFLTTEQTVSKNGKRNEYYLTELVLARSQNKETHGDAILQVPFGYSERKRVEPTLKTFEKSGKLPENSVVRVVNNITINMPVLLGENSSATFNIVNAGEGLEDAMKKMPNNRSKKQFEAMMSRLKTASEHFEKALTEELNPPEQPLLALEHDPQDKN